MIIFEQKDYDASVESFEKNTWHKLVNEFNEIIAYIWCGENHFCCFFLDTEGPTIYSLNKKNQWLESYRDCRLHIVDSLTVEFF